MKIYWCKVDVGVKHPLKYFSPKIISVIRRQKFYDGINTDSMIAFSIDTVE